MSPIKLWKTLPFIILAVLVLILSDQHLSAYGQTPQPTTTPRITPGDFVDALNGAFGKQTINRATHAKGIVLLGRFTPTLQAAGLSTAPHFKEAVPITMPSAVKAKRIWFRRNESMASNTISRNAMLLVLRTPGNALIDCPGIPR